MIAIVDTGGANLSSIQDAFKRLGQTCEVTLDINTLEMASHLILPGVGHASVAMDRLKTSELDRYLVSQKKPTLGICLGMQLLFEKSEEGQTQTLGILTGDVTYINPKDDFRVPHIGWCKLLNLKPSRLLQGISEEEYFYFVHSYKANSNKEVLCSIADYKDLNIPAVVEFKNFFATQFHPEKSGAAGSQILSNFLKITKENL